MSINQKKIKKSKIKKLWTSLRKRNTQFKVFSLKSKFTLKYFFQGQIGIKKIFYKNVLPVRAPAFPQKRFYVGNCNNVHVFLYRYMVADKKHFYLYKKKAKTPKSFSLHLPRKSLIELKIPNEVLGVLSLPLNNLYHTIKDIYFQIFIADKKKLNLPFLFMGLMERFHVDLKRMIFPAFPFIQHPSDTIPVLCRNLRVLRSSIWDIYDLHAGPGAFSLWHEYIEKIIQMSGKEASVPPGGWPSNVYFSRQKSSRRFANGVAVEEMLQKRGFQTVYLEDHSLATQVQFAVNSQTIVGSHGANLTHIFFCRAKTRIIEIASKEFAKNDCYEKAQKINDLNYVKITGSSCKEDEFYLDLEKLSQVL